MSFAKLRKYYKAIELSKKQETYSEIQHLILLPQARHERILGEVIYSGRILLISSLDLLIQG